MGWTPLDGIYVPGWRCCEPHTKDASEKKVSIIGLDLAKNSFQLHGASADSAVLFRKKLSRSYVLKFLEAHPRCIIAMEACASAHHWGRVFGELGHDVRLIAPIYVKPFVKRQKNDATDAEANCEAVTRPSMRFVPTKTRDQQSMLMLHRTRVGRIAHVRLSNSS
jgi:transposase